MFTHRFRTMRVVFSLLAMVTLLQLGTGSVLAINHEDSVERLNNSIEVLKEVLDIPEDGIPNWLVEKSEALIIIPHVVNAAFMVGGRRGHGIMIHRLSPTQWSSPSFVTITGGSFGLQIGGQAIDLILVVNNKRGYRALLEDNFKFGAGASVAAGPVGRNAEAGTNATLKAEIYSYSRSKGLFAGISLEGAALTIDQKANTAFYRKLVNYRQVLNNPTWPFPTDAQPLLNLLRPYSKGK